MKLRELSISELEEMLERYPWFAAAHREFVIRKGGAGDEELRRASAAAVIHFLFRHFFVKSVRRSIKSVYMMTTSYLESHPMPSIDSSTML